MILLFQILFFAFTTFALWSVFQRKRDGLLGNKGVVFWTLFWLVALLVVLWPDSASSVASTFGIGRGSDLIIYASVAVLFYLVFKLHIKLESLGRDLTKVVRDRALQEAHHPTKKNAEQDV